MPCAYMYIPLHPPGRHRRYSHLIPSLLQRDKVLRCTFTYNTTFNDSQEVKYIIHIYWYFTLNYGVL